MSVAIWSPDSPCGQCWRLPSCASTHRAFCCAWGRLCPFAAGSLAPGRRLSSFPGSECSSPRPGRPRDPGGLAPWTMDTIHGQVFPQSHFKPFPWCGPHRLGVGRAHGLPCPPSAPTPSTRASSFLSAGDNPQHLLPGCSEKPAPMSARSGEGTEAGCEPGHPQPHLSPATLLCRSPSRCGSQPRSASRSSPLSSGRWASRTR